MSKRQNIILCFHGCENTDDEATGKRKILNFFLSTFRIYNLYILHSTFYIILIVPQICRGGIKCTAYLFYSCKKMKYHKYGHGKCRCDCADCKSNFLNDSSAGY